MKRWLVFAVVVLSVCWAMMRCMVAVTQNSPPP